MWKHLYIRILVSAVLAAIVAALAVVAFGFYQATESIGERVADFIPQAGTARHRACQRAPESWRLDTQFAVIDAYDLETGRSPNPKALPVDSNLLLKLQSGERRAGRLLWKGPYGGVLLVAVTDKGPCSIFQAHVHRVLGPRQTKLLQLGPVLFALLGVTIFASTGIAVLPLVRRIERIRDAAEHIGQGHRYVSVGDTAADPLGELGRQVDQAHANIAEVHHQLRDRARALEEHLTAVAHDLRTPMSAIQFAIEHASDAPPDQSETLLEHALADVVYLDALVENLGMEVRFRQQAPVEPVATDLRAIVERVSQRFALLGQRRGVDVRHSVPDGPVRVTCDPVAIEQAISNVLQNSVARHPGGQIAVVLEGRPGAAFELNVTDDGPGVPEEVLESLGRGGRGMSVVRPGSRDGLEIGLAISLAVCRAAGWSLEFERGSKRGLTTRIRGPVLGTENDEGEPRT